MRADVRSAVTSPRRVPADLRRRGWLGRFPVSSESEYHAWLASQIIPLVRIVSAISIVFWILIPVSSAFLPGLLAGPAQWGITIYNICLLGLGPFVFLERFPRYAAFSAFSGLVVIGSGAMYVMATWPERPTGPEILTLTAIFFAFEFPFFRVPFRMTVLGTFILISAAALELARSVMAGQSAFLPSFPYFFTLALTWVIVCGMSWVGEQQLRAKFTDERVIARQRDVIRRYVPPTVVEHIERGDAVSVDAPLRRRVTVLSSDVVGFTDLADRVDPETLTQVINEYLGALARIIGRHDGTLNEFAGDGVMALFGAPTEQPPESQVLSAIAAARDIQATLIKLNPVWLKLGIEQPIRTRIGINTGVISVGSFGSEGRATYTGIGLQTNIAARIQTRCDPGGILLSHNSWQLIKEQIPCQSEGEVTVKGVHYPIEVFTPSP